jgi:AraC-like DNA-binding protein
MASETLKEAFERLIRYSRFVSESQAYEFRETDSTFRFVIHPSSEDYPFPDADYDAAFSVLYDMCRNVYGDDFSLMRIDLRRAEPDCAQRFRTRFDAPVVFGAEENVFYISRDVALKPLPTANADLARVNEEVVDQYLNELKQGEMSVRVRRQLIQRLPSGKVSQDEVASELFMSARTLQRRLKEEGTSYQDVLRSTREDLATRYMKDEQTSVSEIAYLLGFSEVANFTRASKS